LERDVAIKVLDPTLALSGELEEQFLREARIVAGVEHPHIVPLYDAAGRGGLLYLVMRLLPGQSLAGRIASDGRIPAADAARLAHEVAMALVVAHECGVVHRDIKPDNILLDASGHATVTDFGISRVTSRPDGEQAGTTTGTPKYMSPEQALGEEVDGRADTYALGVVLFEVASGYRPFEGADTQDVLNQISLARLDVAAALGVDPLVPVLQRALARQAQDGKLDPAAVTPETVTQTLETAFLPPLDLLIRTSGELRLSNFLLWEMSYAEMLVTPVLWPDFSRVDFLQALIDYQSRERRFGAIEAKK